MTLSSSDIKWSGDELEPAATKRLPVVTISVIDLALWDLLGTTGCARTSHELDGAVCHRARDGVSLNIKWWEEVLHPDDIAGYAIIKQALPYIKFTCRPSSARSSRRSRRPWGGGAAAGGFRFLL
ncbi:hypothetical protein DFH09DRAFT_1305134 [Mycena vulgaris]|nr:hypothetical protein DFH09DRAFT_1305134 [Mycena vulgaris]